MKKLKLFSIFCVALFLFGFITQPVLAQPGPPGDANDDGNVSVLDVVYLLDYLFRNEPAPPYPIDADVDGTAGINLGDILQLMEFLFHGCSLMPYTGTGPNISNIEFTFPRIEPGPLGVPYNLNLKLTDNPGPDLDGIVLTFSYQNLFGYVEVNLDSITPGNIVPIGWYFAVLIDNANKKALIAIYPSSGGDPIPTGTTGQIAILYFTRTANATGPATCMSPAVYPPTNSSILISDWCADGTTPLNRVFLPKFGKKGDANSDGLVSVSDVVFLINYLFKGGPVPCGW
jgi:hypothetical protein